MDRDIEDALKRILSRLELQSSQEETPSPNEHWSPERREMEWLRFHGVPPRYTEAMAEGIQLHAQAPLGAYLAKIEENVANGRGVFVCGAVGTGKSCILGIVAQDAYRIFGALPWDYPTMLYANAGPLYSRLIHPGEQESRVLPEEKVPLLLLDELGTAYDTPFAIAQLDSLFEARYSRKRATCVATNMTAKQMRTDARWSRIYDRLKQSCVGIELTGASRRGKQP